MYEYYSYTVQVSFFHSKFFYGTKNTSQRGYKSDCEKMAIRVVQTEKLEPLIKLVCIDGEKNETPQK